MKLVGITTLFICWLSPALHAANQAELREILTEVESIRTDIQKNTASFLLIAKQMTTDQVTTPQAGQVETVVQIINPRVSVYQSDLTTSPVLTSALEGDEFPLIDQQNEWYHIQLKDGREGWIQRENAQLIERESVSAGGSSPIMIDPGVQQMTERLYDTIQNRYERAQQLFDEFEEIYEDLSASEKRNASSVYSTYQDEKEKIETYKAYADHYNKKFVPVSSASVTQSATGSEIGYQGTLSMQVGTSAYETDTEELTTSRNLNLKGSVIFSPQSRLNINLNHNNDVVQTPYTSNDVNLAFQHQTKGGTRLEASMLYNSYNDENIESNNFQNLGVGARIHHPINDETQIFGDVQANKKAYETTGGNDFEGARFNSGLIYNGQKTQANVGVRGRVQSSEISFLEYSRIIPNARVRWLTDKGSISIRGEAEQLAYATEAEANNFNRGRAELEWAGKTSSNAFILISKMFPNNEILDNYTFRLQNRWNRGSGLSSTRSSLSAQYIYYTSENAQSSNYIDLRFDNNSQGESNYFDLNLFGRYWEEENLDHTINLFSRFGYKKSGFQIGPVIGAQLMLNPDDLAIERMGNTLRAGIDARANVAIQKAIVYGDFRFQKSIIYTNPTADGGVDSRMPTTIEFNAGLQVPLIENLELKVDASYFNVDLDFADSGENIPNQTQSGLRFLGGISYRFQK